MKLAPIVLFTYNRPEHTKQVLNSLAKNIESKDSLLYIYCDGAKENADELSLEKIEQTRRIVKTENRFKQVIIIEQLKNKGLANSIIDGITEVLNQHGRVIVLEDDLILSPYFLLYVNDALNRYENNANVAQIGACNFFACGQKYPSSFFLAMTECSGWATWKNRWDHFNTNGQELLTKLQEKNLIKTFNAYGSYDMEGMLKDQIEGRVSSWAIRWQAVCVLNNWLTLYPNPAFSNHIESNEATHANKNVTPPLCEKLPTFKTAKIEEIPYVVEAMKKGYSGTGDYFGNYKNVGLKQQIKNLILNFTPNFVLKRLKKSIKST